MLLAFLALAAQAAEPAAPERWRAVGRSPRWTVRIDGGRMVFERPGRQIVSVGTPAREPTELGHAWWTREFSVSVDYSGCTDRLIRRRYRERVMVRVGEAHFEGCGGDVVRAAPGN